jgi:hypothetical protein
MNAVKTAVVAALGCYIAYKIYDIVVRPHFSVLSEVPGPHLPWLLGFFGRGEDLEFIYELYKYRDEYGSTFTVNGALGARALMVCLRAYTCALSLPDEGHTRRRTTRVRSTTSP